MGNHLVSLVKAHLAQTDQSTQELTPTAPEMRDEALNTHSPRSGCIQVRDCHLPKREKRESAITVNAEILLRVIISVSLAQQTLFIAPILGCYLNSSLFHTLT